MQNSLPNFPSFHALWCCANRVFVLLYSSHDSVRKLDESFHRDMITDLLINRITSTQIIVFHPFTMPMINIQKECFQTPCDFFELLRPISKTIKKCQIQSIRSKLITFKIQFIWSNAERLYPAWSLRPVRWICFSVWGKGNTDWFSIMAWLFSMNVPKRKFISCLWNWQW